MFVFIYLSICSIVHCCHYLCTPSCAAIVSNQNLVLTSKRLIILTSLHVELHFKSKSYSAIPVRDHANKRKKNTENSKNGPTKLWLKNVWQKKFQQIPNRNSALFSIDMLLRSRKKSSSLNGRAIKGGGGVKGLAIKDKNNLFKTF